MAHVFLLPWMIGMVAVTAGPLVASAVLAFTDYDLLSAPQFIGLDNFVRMAGDERFWAAVRVTLVYVLVSVPLQLGFALFLAVVLDKGCAGCRCTAARSTCRRCWAAASPSRSSGGRSSGRTGWSTTSLAGSAWSWARGCRTRRWRCPPSWCSTSGRSAPRW
nr:hypothetical protein GCM10025730_39900 [Promicromonospora thailandica]